MISTKDGHNLRFGDECLIISFNENDEYIESLTKCIYKGFWIRDNKPAINALPQNCSGYMPVTETLHHFKHVHDINDRFDLLTHEVKNIVIRDMSSIEEIVAKKLKD